ncbi:MAG: DUF1499 domain-containing protein [Parvibaculales bacterium]|jgi:uncharacterized protein (DUF1499 family)
MDNKIVGHLAVWGLRLALIAPVIMLIAGGLYRLRFVDFQIALLAFAIAVLIAGLAALFGLVGAVLGGHGKTTRAVTALVVALLVLVAPLNTVRQGAGVPMIHDITTDLEDPPIFVEVPRKRSIGDNSLDIDAEVLAAQKAYYTDIGPTMLPMAKREAFALVREAVDAFDWVVHAENANLGYIEATASTPFFGFRDDVIIRVTEDTGGARVDMRSASRVGLSDLGVNAGRIRDFMAMVTQRAN